MKKQATTSGLLAPEGRTVAKTSAVVLLVPDSVPETACDTQWVLNYDLQMGGSGRMVGVAELSWALGVNRQEGRADSAFVVRMQPE